MKLTAKVKRESDTGIRPFCLRRKVLMGVGMWEYVVSANSCPHSPCIHQYARLIVVNSVPIRCKLYQVRCITSLF